MLAQVEPLSFIAAILGAGGLGVILKIVLNAANKQQTSFNTALQNQRQSYQAFLENQRSEFETFLHNHMSSTTHAMEGLLVGFEKLGDRLTREHEETRDLLKEQARVVRDGHRRLAMELQTNRGTAKAGRALDHVITETEDEAGR